MNYYRNKIVFVTGGASGLGHVLCVILVRCGAQVICADIKFVDDNPTIPGVEYVKLDVSAGSAFGHAITDVVKTHGRIDMLFNNAAAVSIGEMRDMDREQWEIIIDTNLSALISGTMVAYKQMIAQGAGHIINISSAYAMFPYTPLSAPYAITKSALIHFSRLLGLEARELGVMVSVACPGFFKSNIAENAILINNKEDHHAFTEKKIKEGMSAEDVANKILKGVSRGKKVIIFPGRIRLVAFLAHLFSSRANSLAGKRLARFRKDNRRNESNSI